MKCPICGGEMERGGLIADRYVSWVPQEEFERNALQALGGGYNGAKNLGKRSLLHSRTLVPGAWYCDACKVVTGVFDVTSED